MLELFKYLEEHTKCTYELTLNDHKAVYETVKKYWQSYIQDDKDYSDVTWSEDSNIYCFRWYDENAVGFWLFISNTLDGLLDKIKKHIVEQNKETLGRE